MKSYASLLKVFALAIALASSGASAAQPPQESHDGLQLVSSKNAQMLYVRPGATLAQYKRVALLDCYVAFRKNWERDQRESGKMISSADMDRIKKGMAAEFRKVFEAELTKGGYQLSTEGGEDVLILRPAIIDLDITAPDTMSAGMDRTFSTSSGAMTLYIELLDGATGQIIARAADREQARDMGVMMWQNSVTNRAEADRILRKWADAARAALDRAHAATGDTAAKSAAE